MDHFGIEAAMKGMLLNYTMAAKRTGRTTSLVESVKDGDRVVFMDPREADRVKRLCKERGVDIECIVVPPSQPGKMFERSTSQGRTIFDHSWVEKFYLQAIESAAREIDELERETSGYGAAHRETRRRFEELSRWR